MAASDELVADVFQSLSVTPRHGEHAAAILWSVIAGWGPATFMVQKSPDGLNGWVTIGRVVGQRWFDDLELFPGGRYDEPFYRVFARHADGSKAWSPSVGAFAQLSRAEFGVANKIIRMEAQQLRTRSPALLLKLNPAAPLCPACTDTTTGQRLVTSFCATCHGAGKTNAYFPGLATYVWFLSASDRTKVAKEDGSGLVDEQVLKARMLAIPPLDREDMLVETARDHRWLVESVNHGMFNGKVPVTCDLTLRMLARTDVRHQVPLT